MITFMLAIITPVIIPATILTMKQRVFLLLIGLLIALLSNLIFQPKFNTRNARKKAQAKMKESDYKLIGTHDLRPFETTEPLFGGYAEICYIDDLNGSVKCIAKDPNGIFRTQYFPKELCTFIPDEEKKLFVYAASKFLVGDLFLSILPGEFGTLKYEFHMPLPHNIQQLIDNECYLNIFPQPPYSESQIKEETK